MPQRNSISPTSSSLIPAESLYPTKVRPSAEAPLAMRLVCVETQVEIERMARAVQSVRDLDHRAVRKPLQMVRSSTRLGVITQHIEGITLAQLLANANTAGVAVPPAVALRIIVDVLEGLEALRAHATAARRQDWLFGGLTPDSIFVGADGQSSLLDPGLTGAAARLPAFAHEPAALAYTAPELTSPDAQYTAACDVFSLGVMLWELLTGQPLFAAGTAAQTLENLHRAPIARVQRNQFVRGEPIAFALAQTVASALKRTSTQRLRDYDSLSTALLQAGPIGRPEVVAELVQRCSRKEDFGELSHGIALPQDTVAEEAPVTSPKITVPITTKIPTRTQPGLAPPSALLPSVVPPRFELPSPSTAPADSALPERSRSRATTTRIRKVPSARPGASRPEPRPANPPADLRMRSDIVDQVSAFPIGDLKPATQRRSSFVPMAIAATVLLGLGAWSLRLFEGGGKPPELSPAAASGHAPQPPAAQAPEGSPPSESAGAEPHEALQTDEKKPDVVAPGAAAPSTAAQLRREGPTKAAAAPIKQHPKAKTEAKARPEPKRPGPDASVARELPHFSELPPPEPERVEPGPATQDNILKITPAPARKPPAPDIPDDI
jgi:serine/threonine-protein kinase